MVQQRPALRDLPEHINKELALPPGLWLRLPVKHRRKRLGSGFVAHLYAEAERFALKAMKERGLGKSILVDIKRGETHKQLPFRDLSPLEDPVLRCWNGSAPWCRKMMSCYG